MPMTTEDRNMLLAFLADLRSLFRLVVYERSDLVASYLHPVLAPALQEIEPQFETVMVAVDRGAQDDRLEGAGLTGSSLRLKMTGFQRARRVFLDNPIRRLLLNVLRWANIALGSLASIINAAEPIQEFKEALEAGVEEQG